MPVSADYLVYVADQLASFARVRSRRMFGAVGLYADDIFFALIDNDTLYFKVDDSNRPDYVARGCEPFRPFADETISLSYFMVPPEVIEDSDELKLWARKAHAAALVKAARKSVKPRGKAKKPAAKNKSAKSKTAKDKAARKKRGVRGRSKSRG
jgi:DNA transformation protein